MSYDNYNFINFDTNSDGMYQNGKPNVGTSDECPDNYHITNFSQTVVKVLGG